MELDLINKKILGELELNSRAPISKISKKVKCSRDKVEYRIKKMEEIGIIKGYNAYVDVSKFGYKMYRVYLNFFALSKIKFESLINILKKEEAIFWVGEVDGFTDLVFGGWFKSGKEFQDFYIKILTNFRKYLKLEKVNEVLYYSYLNRAYIFNKGERSKFLLGGSEKMNIDLVDMKILKELSLNARISVIEIASKLKLDSSSIISRIKKLEKQKIILGYRMNLDLSKIGRSFYSVKIYLDNFVNKTKIENFLFLKDFVTNFTSSIGGWDLEFDIEVENDKEYFSFIEELKEKFDSIIEISFFRAKKIFKVINLPNLK